MGEQSPWLAKGMSEMTWSLMQMSETIGRDARAAVQALTGGAVPEEMCDEPDDETGLTAWWLGRAQDEIGEIADKSRRYGSNSLTQLGHHVARLQDRTVDDTEALELGCWINIVQKVERMTDAVLRGEQCGSDSIHDIHVYALMILRIRETGDWP